MKKVDHERFTKEEMSAIRQRVCYCKESGEFTWSQTMGPLKAGRPITKSAPRSGYRQISMFGKTVTLHRLAFLLVIGRFPLPGLVVDHIDRDKTNNAWSNLREVTPEINYHNYETPWVRNVRQLKNGKFRASFYIRGTKYTYSPFETEEEATEWVRSAKSSLLRMPVLSKKEVGCE